MTFPADYHMHTPLCRHATGEPVELAARAVALNIDEIGFSDHSPTATDGFDDWRMVRSELPQYLYSVEQARQRFPKLSIKVGLEIDYIPGHEDWIRELRAIHPWDYFIGSVHYLDGNWALDNPHFIEEWDRRGTMEVWTDYFERLTMAAESGLFEIIGHADLCKKFGHKPERDCTPLYKKFISAAAKSKAAIELNTAGLRKQCKEIYPSLQILQMAKSAGLPITFGSDAHCPEELGADFDAAIKLAKQVGYTHTLRFSKGVPRSVPIAG